MPSRKSPAVYSQRICPNSNIPDDWEFMGSLAQQYKQISVTLPVNMGIEFGYSIVNFLNQHYRLIQRK
ncbi:MAG: hypothetical protein A2W97_09400 [Bacteroidetes bacterium GWE2_40_63]|nr:MAG: hypothetical protein A2W96_07440 [Bacteroidetes bacterium GWD2_40_43]OFX88427.1 MAG: hypothetical protein A2W97_09400 [Bacteroidetes bacterium GWE2_40_63]OFY23352.1 MAG: hypothetical protein A2W88_10650 [Bacteroidetes bacterium GWF2_40_13]OFZ29600.1 MAG: hypothetical protein A2437_08870 [Bacteroidetes bacterium RIFOXYC2_FULL_40_12]